MTTLKAAPYKHKDCGGVLIPGIWDEIKTSAPPLYWHRCTGCKFQRYAQRAHEAWYVPEFAFHFSKIEAN